MFLSLRNSNLNIPVSVRCTENITIPYWVFLRIIVVYSFTYTFSVHYFKFKYPIFQIHLHPPLTRSLFNRQKQFSLPSPTKNRRSITLRYSKKPFIVLNYRFCAIVTAHHCQVFETQTTMDPIWTTGNGSLLTNDNSNNFENIVICKGAITIPSDIPIVHKETASAKKSRKKRKRTRSIFDEMVVGKKSVAQLNSMVDQNHRHMDFLSQCGKLSKNRECVISEDINNLASIIQRKQSVESCNDVSEKHITLNDSSQSVSCKIYNYNSLYIVGQ